MPRTNTLSETEREKAVSNIREELDDIRSDMEDSDGSFFYEIEQILELLSSRKDEDGKVLHDLDVVIRRCLERMDAAERLLFVDFGQDWHSFAKLRDRLEALNR